MFSFHSSVEYSMCMVEFFSSCNTHGLCVHLHQVIADITKRMGAGMAEFVSKDLGQGTVTTSEYNLYCHFVAGLVGDGLTRLFAATGIEGPEILLAPELANRCPYNSYTHLLLQVRHSHVVFCCPDLVCTMAARGMVFIGVVLFPFRNAHGFHRRTVGRDVSLSHFRWYSSDLMRHLLQIVLQRRTLAVGIFIFKCRQANCKVRTPVRFIYLSYRRKDS